jgi:hypothetical protein
MGITNKVRQNRDGTTDVLLERGKVTRVKTAEYQPVASFYWFIWQTPTGREYAISNVLVDGALMFITMPDLLSNPNAFQGITATRPSGFGEGLHCGAFDNPEDAARAYDRAMLRYFGPDEETNESLGLLPPDETEREYIIAGQVITPAV